MPYVHRACQRTLAGLLAAVVVVLLGVLAAPAPASAAAGTASAHTWGVDGRVTAMVTVGGRVYLGGDFTHVVDTAGNTYPAAHLAVFDPASGRFDLSWQAGTDDDVTALATDGTALFIAGSFASVDGVARTRLAAVTLSSGSVTSWAPAAKGAVGALAVGGGAVYAGGTFTAITSGATTTDRAGLARMDATSGAVDPSWAPSTDGAAVRALTVSADGSHVLVGGDFRKINGVLVNKLASVFAAGGAVDTGFVAPATNNGAYAPVTALATNGNLLAIGVEGSGGACAAADPATGRLIWSDHANGNMQAVLIRGSSIYCGGHFGGSGSFAGAARDKVAQVDAGTGAVQGLAPNVNSALGVWSLAADSTHLYMGGDFTKVSQSSQQHVAMFTDTAAQTAPSGPQALAASAPSGSVSLTWSAPDTDGGSPVTSYAVLRSTGGGTPTVVGRTSSTGYTDRTVSDGTTYNYSVQAQNAVGTGPASASVAATPGSSIVVPPAAPTGLSAAAGAATISLSWVAPTSNGGAAISGYRLYRGTSSAALSPLATVAGTTYADDSAVVGTTYYYAVTAVNSAGESAASAQASATAYAGAPSAPTLSGTAGSGQVTVTWTPGSDGGSPVTKYILVRDGVRLATFAPDVRSYTDTGLASGMQHQYQLREQNSIGGSPYSNTVTIAAG